MNSLKYQIKRPNKARALRQGDFVVIYEGFRSKQGLGVGIWISNAHCKA